MKRSLLLIVASTLISTLLHAAPTTEVITLNYGLAEGMIPAVQPMLRDDERVSAYGNQLIIRAEPERIAEIRQMLGKLDRQPVKLRISVANTSASNATRQGYSIDGRISTGPVDIVTGDRSTSNQTRIIRRETRGSNDAVRQITASEGYPVLIQQGQSVPITSTTTNAYGQVMEQTQYRDVTQGFYATVRLNGDFANITLSSNNDRVNASDSRLIDVQRSDTVLTARLGEWVSVGGIDDTATGEDRGLGRRTRTSSAERTSLRLMVERLD